MVGDGEDEMALGDQDPDISLLGASPNEGDVVTPGDEDFHLDGSISAFDDLSFLPSSESSANFFSSAPQVDQAIRSDFAFFPSTGADFSPFLPSISQDNNDIFVLKPGLGDNSNSEGLSFALAPGADGTGDGSLSFSG